MDNDDHGPSNNAQGKSRLEIASAAAAISGVRAPGATLLRHLRTLKAARYLGVSVSFLNYARLRGTGPTYKKLSPKLIVYSIEDLRTWANSKSRCSTSNSSLSHT